MACTIGKYADSVDAFLKTGKEFSARDLSKAIGVSVEKARRYIIHMHKKLVIQACGIHERITSKSLFVYTDTVTNERWLRQYLFCQERPCDYNERRVNSYWTKLQITRLTAEIISVLLSEPRNSARVTRIHAVLQETAEFGKSPKQIYRVLKLQNEIFTKDGVLYKLINADIAKNLYTSMQAEYNENNGGPIRSLLGRS